MRGRVTADKCNAALDELAGLAEANAAMVAAARRNRATGPDKKHAMWVAFNLAVSGAGLGGCWGLWLACFSSCICAPCATTMRTLPAQPTQPCPATPNHPPLCATLAQQTHEQLKGGRSWLLESDLRTGSAVRLDKSGRTLLTLLRHLGRLQELRVQADGATHLVYILLE